MNPMCHRYNQSWNKRNEHLMSTQRYPHEEANVTPLPLFPRTMGSQLWGVFRCLSSVPLPFPSCASNFPWVNPLDNFP